MAKTKITKELEKQIYEATKKQGVFGCFEVTVDWYGNERVDYITYDTKDIWRCYEIKTSKSDFYSKARKTFLGHYNYYVMTKEVYEQVKDDIPPHIGVYVGGLCVKKAKKQELGIDAEILKNSLIRSLYRDFEKLMKLKNPNYINKLKSKINKLEKEKNEFKNQYYDLYWRVYCKFGKDWEKALEIQQNPEECS